jgi:hypothetical protein
MIQKEMQFKSERVTYRDVNLRDMHGTIVNKLPPAPYNGGSFCLVKWDRYPQFDSVEWKPNLEVES